MIPGVGPVTCARYGCWSTSVLKVATNARSLHGLDGWRFYINSRCLGEYLYRLLSLVIAPLSLNKYSGLHRSRRLLVKGMFTVNPGDKSAWWASSK